MNNAFLLHHLLENGSDMKYMRTPSNYNVDSGNLRIYIIVYGETVCPWWGNLDRYSPGESVKERDPARGNA